MTEEQQLATVPTVDAGLNPLNGPGDLDIVRIYNEELDAYGESPRAGVAFLAGWEVADPTPQEAEQLLEGYDPAAYSRDEVFEYLETATATERDAVLVREAEGKKRKTILEWTPPDEDESS